MATPPRLYKYEGFTTRALQNLKSQVLYFGSPLNFNDPYDCALTPSIAQPSDEEVEAIRQAYLQDKEVPPIPRQQLTAFNTAQLREIFMRSGSDGLAKSINEFLHQRGIACFSERYDDLLMWSHYGGRYKGFCLEFDSSSEPFLKTRPVDYVARPPSLSLKDLLLVDFDPVEKLFCTKSEAWVYEKEWRTIHDKAGTEYVYPAEALTGVYFGPDIDQQSIEIVCLILSGQNENVRFWRGSRSGTDFRVLFEPFTYTSFIEAKRRGLR